MNPRCHCGARVASNAMDLCEECWIAFLVVMLEIDHGWKSVN